MNGALLDNYKEIALHESLYLNIVIIKAVTTKLRYIHSFSFNYVFILQIHNLITKLLQKKIQNLGNLLFGRF